MAMFKRKSSADHINRLLAEGRLQEAIDLCGKACQAAKATAEDWRLYGCLCADTGDLATARSALLKAIKIDPGLVAAQVGLGKVLATTGDYTAAIERLQHATELEPDNADIWLALGITFGLANQLPEAEECCRRSLVLQPGSANALFNLANALQAQGRLSDAETEYEAALSIKPDLTDGWYMLAQARLGMRKFAEAEVAAAEALKLNAGKGEVYITLGSIAAARSDLVQARDYFREAADRLPGSPDAHMRLGQALFELMDYNGAADSFHAVVALDPNRVEGHFLMGGCFEERKLIGRAEICYRKALALNPDHLQAHNRLAFICVRMNRRDQAASHFAEVLRLDPGDEQARHLLAAQRGETTAMAPASYVATLFDGVAETFDTTLVDELGYQAPGILFEMVSPYMTPGMSKSDVIDLGCGTGLCAPLFRGMARTLHGVDISSRMIDKAGERGLYDTLEVNDVATSLSARVAAWDLAISADVFVYLGDLRGIFTACSSALKPGGLFAFSVEDGDDAGDFILRDTGRYAHSRAYIQRLAAETDFSEVVQRAIVVRKDKGSVDINGYIILLRRAGATA